MKKILVFIVCISVAIGTFCACSKSNEKNEKSTTAAAKNTTTAVTTDSAVIKEADAINLVESYSDKELGLTAKDRKAASFMVASGGVKIDKDYYIEVVATIKNEHKKGDKVTYTFDHLGMYYIRYDGKKILRKDMNAKTTKYIDMKIKAVPSTTAHEHTHEHSEEEKKDE